MWKIKVEITISSDDIDENKEIKAQIEESIPSGFQSLDKWEQYVRDVGFRTMRELFKDGIELYEEDILFSHSKEHSDKEHGDDSQMVRCGHREFTLKTVFGKVMFPRQRMFCKECRKWLLPINDALGLHNEENERATIGFKELSNLCAINQPYRLATEMVRQITQEPDIVSHEQVRQIVQEEGIKIRQREEEERKDSVFCYIKSIQNKLYSRPHKRTGWNGRFYVFMDGTFIRSNEGKDRYYEGKVGFICTDRRESAGNRLKIPIKRYISSFEDSIVLGSRVRGEALKLALRAYRDIFLIGDGARWIRKIHEQCFPEATYILDWYHLRKNLYTALELTLPKAERWRIYKELSKYLWRGRKSKALNELKALCNRLLSEGKGELIGQRGGLVEFIEYIQNNWEGIIKYRDMWRSGYLVSSSLVEKAVDLVIAKRQKKSQGMHWSRVGADSVCALRTLWLNGDWHDYWWERRDKAA